MSLSPLGVTPPRVAAPLPVPDFMKDEGNGPFAYQMSYEALPVFDRNRDSVLTRDEFTSTHFDRLDLDRSNGITREELEAGYKAESNEQLWHLANNSYHAGLARKRHQDIRKAGLWTAGVSLAAGAAATAVLGASAFVIAPAALLAGIGALAWWGQKDKDRQVTQAWNAQLLDALEQKPVAWNEFDTLQVSQPVQVAEKVVNVAWKVLSLPGKFLEELKNFGEFLLFLFGGI